MPKYFKAPELNYLILVTYLCDGLKHACWCNAFWVSFWLIMVGWASCRVRKILLSGVEIFLMGIVNAHQNIREEFLDFVY